ncbi:MAG: hypothetical protein ACD_56C00096G0006 [uncultured bacterium]|nr:MAG: hypothetical protein ACD_56C00096G0006 [uncultured bacterium]
MKNILEKNWISFKQNPEIWFFYIFLATSTLSIRKIIYSFKIDASFNEYSSAYIYLSDILLFLTFISFILYNINSILSNIRSSFSKNLTQIKMFHVEHFKSEYINTKKCLHCSTPACPVGRWNNSIIAIKIVPRGTISIIRKTYAHIVNNYLTIFPLFMAFFAFISILWTTNKQIGLFRSVKLAEFILLYFYIIHIVPRGTISIFATDFQNKIMQLFHVEQFKRFFHNNTNAKQNCSTWNNSSENTIVPPILNFSQALYKGNSVNKLIVPRGTIIKNILILITAVGFIQSIIGIWQFILQHSIGFFWLKESIISQSLPGVAKILLDGNTIIRAYGLFPHPNILGGYLVFSIISTLLLSKLFHVEQFKIKSKPEPKEYSCSTWNNLNFLFNTGITIQLMALALTFSKSATIGLLMGLFYIFKKEKLFHVEQFTRKSLLIIAILTFSWLLLDFDYNSLFIKSLRERELYLNVSRGTFFDHPILGTGAGQFIFEVAKIPDIRTWQLQPVHNVPLLILNEYGLFITLGFLFFLWNIFAINCSTCLPDRQAWNNAEKRQATYLKGILLAFMFVMLFDHYLWDIQQGQIMLWTLLALIVSSTKTRLPNVNNQA